MKREYELEHTKGEWYANNCMVVKDGTMDEIALCFDIKPELPYKEMRANAKLIAAAPKLLLSLKYYFDVLEEVRGQDWDKNPDHVLAKMINAYKDATE